ncbi:MAG: hypothetical protein IPL61_23720 [Myxococcales bacterium]|nr:hypothetical protein [Myxococcales bacterium]
MSRSVRRALIPITIAAASMAQAGAAAAQHCHIDTPTPTAAPASDRAVAVTVGTRWTAGAGRVVVPTSTAMAERAYQGGDLFVSVGWRRVTGAAALGAFHVADDGTGLDDLRASLAVRLTPAAAPITVSAIGGASLPTGDADAGRGMGHVMVAGGASAHAGRGRLAADATVTYARALGDGAAHAAHAHGAELWPLIDPMGAEEVTVDVGASAVIGPPGVSARVGALLGEPLAHGERRVIASVGATLDRGRYRAGATVSAPAVGDAFIARGQLELAYRY